MVGLKHIDRYILKNFFKTFIITFVASIFILVMQFVFHNIDDLVGKGVGFGVLGEFFFYACLTLVPLSLPLSILMGSLMTFGNLGERLELLAMKAAGISLFRIMRSLIFTIALMAVASFYFSDYVLPHAQVRMWTLVFSLREKSPELNIPEGAFYNGITGRNIYVGSKSNKMLRDVIIYDFSNGFHNTTITLADTGYISMSANKQQLLLRLHNGETFEHLQQGDVSKKDTDIIPYRRETFGRKELLIDYDANFNEMNSDFLEGQYVSKNTIELEHATDSIDKKITALKENQRTQLLTTTYFNKNNLGTDNAIDTSQYIADKPTEDFYQRYTKLSESAQKRVINAALAHVRLIQSESIASNNDLNWLHTEKRRHSIEWHKRHSLPFACLVFLFIGAPLGAIIRKGGMGMPLVLSTLLFITYYIIDNTGYKMAREGIWETWQGMWLSAFVLLPIGIILTIMAATDSTVMNGESYKNAIKIFFSKKNPIFAYLKRNK
ncbi:MAG: LptF/LptG family permease [Paludibacteraceae bacterium]|nr:LptF/LptG family permease [Paludibacteraceae bacterium]